MFVPWLRDFVEQGTLPRWLRDATALVQDEGGGWDCTRVLSADVLLRCDEFRFSCIPKPPSQERAGLVPPPRPLRSPPHTTQRCGGGAAPRTWGAGPAPRDSEPHSGTEMFMPAPVPRPPKPAWRRRRSGFYTVPFVFTPQRSVSHEPRSRRGGPRRPSPQPQDSPRKTDLCKSLSMHLWTQVAQPNSVDKNRSPVSVTVPDPLLVRPGTEGRRPQRRRLRGRQAGLFLWKSQLLCRGHARIQQPNRLNVATGDSRMGRFPLYVSRV